jgi:hypothetical protein
MKKFFFILAFCTSNLSWGQNNLQFNSAVFNSIEGISNQQIVGTIIVPQGKVMKIESASVVAVEGFSGVMPPTHSNQGILEATINNMLVFSSEKDTKFPVWLPTGTYNVRIYCGTNPLNTFNHSFSYSGVLFNLVP